MELRAVLPQARRRNGEEVAADACDLAPGGHLGPADVFKLRVEDAMVSAGFEGETAAAPRLGVVDGGERHKTGARQGVLIGRPRLVEMAQRRAAASPDGKKGEPFFDISVERCRRALKRAFEDVEIPSFPANSDRHSGLSHGAAAGYRAAWQIQGRGRRQWRRVFCDA